MRRTRSLLSATLAPWVLVGIPPSRVPPLAEVHWEV